MVHFNLFKSAKCVQEQQIKQQKWSTRLFIIMLCAAVLIITVYSSISQQTRIVVTNPSLESIEKLQANPLIASSLLCPCSQYSSAYKNIIHLTPNYHQICSSHFVTSSWITVLGITKNNSNVLFGADFRGYYLFFQLLQSLCILAKDTVSNAVLVFGNSQLVTAELLTRQVFHNQMNSSVEFFTRSTANDFVRLIHLLSNVTQANQYVVGASNNFMVILTDNSAVENNTFYPLLLPAFFMIVSQKLVLCSCINDTSCKLQVGIYAQSIFGNMIYPARGLFMGCTALLSLYISTLECLYDNNDCLSQISLATGMNLYSNVSLLNSKLPSKFSSNSTISTLLEQLFIESWTLNISLEK